MEVAGLRTRHGRRRLSRDGRPGMVASDRSSYAICSRAVHHCRLLPSRLQARGIPRTDTSERLECRTYRVLVWWARRVAAWRRAVDWASIAIACAVASQPSEAGCRRFEGLHPSAASCGADRLRVVGGAGAPADEPVSAPKDIERNQHVERKAAPRSSCSLLAFLRSFATHLEKARFADASCRLLVLHDVAALLLTARPPPDAVGSASSA